MKVDFTSPSHEEIVLTIIESEMEFLKLNSAKV
jgi:hypothetical protein